MRAHKTLVVRFAKPNYEIFTIYTTFSCINLNFSCEFERVKFAEKILCD